MLAVFALVVDAVIHWREGPGDSNGLHAAIGIHTADDVFKSGKYDPEGVPGVAAQNRSGE